MSLMDEIRKIPPVTRFLLGSSLGITLPLLGGLISPYPIFFDWRRVRDRFEIWRAFTSFFFAGSGMSLIFDIAMLYRNSTALEEGHYSRRSADYAYHLILSAASIIVLNIPLKSPVHFRQLLISITTTASLLNPDGQASLFGLFSFPQKYFPLALLAMDFVQGGPGAAAQAVTGIITGYALGLVEWRETPGSPPPGSGRLVGRAPNFLRNLVGDQTTNPIPPVAGAVHVQAPRGRSLNDGGRSTTSTTTTTGYRWGTGRRLGDS